MLLTTTGVRRVTFGPICLLLPAGAAPRGEPEGHMPQDLEPVVEVYSWPGFGPRDFERGKAAYWPLDTSSWFAVSITADVSRNCSTQLRMMRGASGPPEEPASAEWTLDARLVDTRGHAATVDLKWTRTVHDPVLVPRESVTVEQRVTLHDGSKGILDFVRTESPAASDCAGFAIGLGLEFVPRATVQDAGFEYDVWLIERSIDGTEQSLHAITSGRQGSAAPFVFEPLAFGENGRPSTVADAPFRMTVSGRVRSHARQDGSIDLSVETSRGFRTARGGSSVTDGWKRLTVAHGETVEFEMPRADRAGVPDVLPGHRTAIRVTTKRLW